MARCYAAVAGRGHARDGIYCKCGACGCERGGGRTRASRRHQHALRIPITAPKVRAVLKEKSVDLSYAAGRKN